MPLYRRNTGGGSSTALDATARATSTANMAEIQDLELQQAAQDALIASMPTAAEFAALEALVASNVDKSPKAFNREPDGRLKIIWEDDTETFVGAPIIKDGSVNIHTTNVADFHTFIAAQKLDPDNPLKQGDIVKFDGSADGTGEAFYLGEDDTGVDQWGYRAERFGPRVAPIPGVDDSRRHITGDVYAFYNADTGEHVWARSKVWKFFEDNIDLADWDILGPQPNPGPSFSYSLTASAGHNINYVNHAAFTPMTIHNTSEATAGRVIVPLGTGVRINSVDHPIDPASGLIDYEFLPGVIYSGVYAEINGNLTLSLIAENLLNAREVLPNVSAVLGETVTYSNITDANGYKFTSIDMTDPDNPIEVIWAINPAAIAVDADHVIGTTWDAIEQARTGEGGVPIYINSVPNLMSSNLQIATDVQALGGTSTDTAVSPAQMSTALLFKQDRITPQTSVRADGVATDNDYVTEKAVRDALDTLNSLFTGGVVSPSGASYGTLAAIPGDASAAKVYWTGLTTDDVGTGTVENPQYRSGIYITDGSAWSFYQAQDNVVITELTLAQILRQSGDAGYGDTYGLVNEALLDEFLKDRQTPTSFAQAAGTMDLTAIPDLRQNIRYFIRNTSKTAVLNAVFGAANQFGLRRVGSDGTESVIPAGPTNTSFDIGVNEWAIVEYNEDGATVETYAFKSEYYMRLATKPTSAVSVPFDVLVLVLDTRQLWANVTGVTESFSGNETANWKIINSGSESVKYPGDNGVQLAGFDNVFYQDEAVGAAPTAESGQEYSTSVIQANSSDTTAVKNSVKAVVSHYRAVDNGAGFVWVETQTPTNDILLNQFVRQEDIAATGGEWVPIGGDLEIRAGGDNNIVNFPRLRTSGTADMYLHVESWWHASATAEGTGYDTKIERLAVGEEWNVRENTAYNLFPGYIQHLIISETSTGRQWLVYYLDQADDASILLSYTYRGGDIFAVPEATTTRDKVTITANAGAVTVLGGDQAFTGTPNGVSLEVPAGQRLISAVADNGATASISDRYAGLVEVSVPNGTTGTVDITCVFGPGSYDVDAGWEIRGDILECWGISNSGIVTLPNGLEYADSNYNLQATVNVGSNGDHTNNILFNAKGFQIDGARFRLKAQLQSGATTSSTAWPMSWRTIGRIA